MSQHPRTADLEALLEALCAADIEFIVVGGAAAVLHGAPITTQDLDIVHSRQPDNVRRLVELLGELDALFRPVLPGRHLRPSVEHLSGDGHVNLSTRLGPLDHLCLMDGRSYDDLLPPSDRCLAPGDRCLAPGEQYMEVALPQSRPPLRWRRAV